MRDKTTLTWILGLWIVQSSVQMSPLVSMLNPSPIHTHHRACLVFVNQPSWSSLRVDCTSEEKHKLNKVEEGEGIIVQGIRKGKEETECDSSSSSVFLEEVSKPFLPIVSSFSQSMCSSFICEYNAGSQHWSRVEGSYSPEPIWYFNFTLKKFNPKFCNTCLSIPKKSVLGSCIFLDVVSGKITGESMCL